MAQLRAKKNPLLKDTLFPLVFDTTVIGRHPYCEIVLDHGAISREHARIIRDQEIYYIEDLHSRNGTFLNGKPVERKQPLYEGDVIRICDMDFTFYSGDADKPSDSSLMRPGHDVVYDDTPVNDSLYIMSQVPVVTQDQDTMPGKSNADVKFRALVDLGRNLNSVLEDMLPHLAANLLRFFKHADGAYVFLRNPESQKLELKAFQHRKNSPNERLHISRTILEKAAAAKTAILSNDVSGDSWFDTSQSIVDYQICSIMVTPLLDFNNEVFGVIQLDSRSGGHRFTSDDLDLLVTVTYQAAISYENARRYERIAQERVLEREMSVAHKVQLGFLPIQPPKLENYAFFDYYQPAKYLGGDYFDYIELPDGRLAVTLGDVSGKGVPAALLMAKLSAEVRYSLVIEPTPAQAMQRLNRVFCEDRWDSRFITFMLTVLDPKTHQIVMLNAGHNPPLFRDRNGQIREIADNLGGLPLGTGHETVYREDTLIMEPEELIVIYSDGLLDAMNTGGNFYELRRIREQVGIPGQTSVDAVGRSLMNSIRKFVGSAPQTDDQCLVIFGRYS
ncbi:MAG: SpoIIE family protein phosphatase [Planctomycetaceae bacterium]|jgi:serine phosphatase RsbU (regulator of sigma subunit)|nr:SpoIIE family protein phosphatase [Planctomycetaceae bacterium]